MIKVFLLMYRKPGMSCEEFLQHWIGPHKELALESAGPMRLRRYVQNHPSSHPMAQAMCEGRGTIAADFDGIAEAWWDSFEDLAEVGNTAGEIASVILEDESRFIDMPRSQMWFAEEHEFIGPGAK